MTMIMSMTILKHLMTHSFMLLILMPQLCNVLKRVKRDKQPKWITREIINEMFKRDSLRKRGCFTEYRISRNKVVSMIRSRKVQFY